MRWRPRPAKRLRLDGSVPLLWITDPHLNHVSPAEWERWTGEIVQQRPDGLLLTGDISEGDDVIEQLQRLAQSVDVPLYFVLGNHDFYHSSIAATRRAVIEAAREQDQLLYLSDLDPIEIAEDVYLVGDDGWGDATEGDYHGTTVRLNDFRLIEEFVRASPERWQAILQQQGLESAQRLAHKLASIPVTAKAIIVATHVPPFREACWYEGHTTDDNWAPFFVCGQVGKALREAARKHAASSMTVLCGHTHHAGMARIADNLVVHTGAAQYGTPAIQGKLDIDVDGQVTMR